MDPYLKAILDSGIRPDQLLAPERDPRAGLDTRAVNDPLLARRRFAAATPQEARQNAYATALEEPTSAAKNVAQMILQLFGRGSLETQDRMHRELETAGQGPNKWTWDDAALALDATPMAPVVGILAGGRGAQKVGGKVLERFLAGREAAQAPGVGAQTLWRQHGYDPGVDRLGRWEISDVASEVVAGGPQYKGPVGQALKHEDLYAAYPELKDMPLDMRINAELAASGSYNPRTGRLAVRAPSVEEARSVLLHELQHPVQQLEGHPGGTNLSGGLEKYLREAGEVEAANVQTRLADPDLMKFAPEMTERVPRIEQLISQDPQAVMLAVKEKGGMWHPEAVQRLAEPLDRKLAGDAYGVDVNLSKESAAAYDWSQRAIRNYLNKYAGTKEDPLKDVEIPFGEGVKRWEEVTDAAIGKTTADEYRFAAFRAGGPSSGLDPKIPPSELIYNFRKNEGGKAVVANESLKSYLSHVGDYLRQNVPPEKLSQYDLVRAVKETAANDARVAKQMAKAQADSTKYLPVHKEYPDGFKWVELKLPERLTPEQARQVRPMTREEMKQALREDPGGMGDDLLPGDQGFVAVGPDGKPITNSYTGGWAHAATPEEAWLAGRLAEEGNQMGHCVGGYCEPVASGESKIYSLRGPDGKSHVTVEVAPPDVRQEAYTPIAFYKQAPKEIQERLGFEPKRADPQWESEGDFTRRHRFWRQEIMKSPEFKQWIADQGHSILQIKGKQNRAPAATYLPYVQDFVKSGKWGEVGDLGNTGLRKTRFGYLTETDIQRLRMEGQLRPLEDIE